MISFEITVLDDAEVDLDESFLWYESQSRGLGEKFIYFVNKAFEFISGHPNASEIKQKSVHRFVMDKFPYGIY